MIYIDMEQERFASFIKQLPTLLENGWKIPDEARIRKDICPDEDYFVCEYIGDEIDTVLLYIYKKSIGNTDKHAVIISPTEKEISVLKGERLKAACNHFSEMLKKQGVCVDVCYEEEEEVTINANQM